jgi:hypothetical protein
VPSAATVPSAMFHPSATCRDTRGKHRQPYRGAVALHEAEPGRRKFRRYLLIGARHRHPSIAWKGGIRPYPNGCSRCVRQIVGRHAETQQDQEGSPVESSAVSVKAGQPHSPCPFISVMNAARLTK